MDCLFIAAVTQLKTRSKYLNVIANSEKCMRLFFNIKTGKKTCAVIGK